jgi:hypothetical protein
LWPVLSFLHDDTVLSTSISISKNLVTELAILDRF